MTTESEIRKEKRRIYVRDWKRRKRAGIPRKDTSKDLLGMRFGRLVAIEKTNKKMGSCVVWICRCSCGKEIETSSNRLLFGKSISCGCHKAERRVRSIDNLFLKRFKERARYCKIQWSLNDKYALFLAHSPCYYCGEMDKRRIKINDDYVDLVINGIDRVDNSIGYIYGNVVSCCRSCNTKKGAVTTNIMKKALRFILG